MTAAASSAGGEGVEGGAGAGDPSMGEQLEEEEEGYVPGDGAIKLEDVNGTI